MKKFFLLLVVVSFSWLKAYGQAALVFDASLNAFMESSHIDQKVHYAQMVKDNVQQIMYLKDQLEQAAKTVQMTAQNLQSLKDVNNWDDFMNWYNRQLYYERMSIETVKGMNVNIGKKNYSIYDLEGMAQGFDDTYVSYWEDEFTEEQRREMWLGLGLTPSNYAYVQPYREKGRQIARELFTLSEIQNEKNNKASEANKKDLDDLKYDSTLPPDEQMGEKEVLQRVLQSSIRNGEVLEDIAAIEAKRAEADGIDRKLKEPLKQGTVLSKFPNNAWDLTKK